MQLPKRKCPIPKEIFVPILQRYQKETGRTVENFGEYVYGLIREELSKHNPVWAGIHTDDLIRWAGNVRRRGDLGSVKGHGPAKADPLSDDLRERLCEADWLELREKVLARAEYRCQVCNGEDTLQAHHRSYERMRREGELLDLICVCRKCHKLCDQRRKAEYKYISSMRKQA